MVCRSMSFRSTSSHVKSRHAISCHAQPTTSGNDLYLEVIGAAIGNFLKRDLCKGDGLLINNHVDRYHD